MSNVVNDRSPMPDQVMEDYLFELFDETDNQTAVDSGVAEIKPYQHAEVFDCAGVRMAIDADRIVERIPLDQFERLVPGDSGTHIEAEWQGRKARLLDLAALILPADLPRRAVQLSERAKEAIMLNSDCGLILGMALDQFQLVAAESRWRTSASRKPWLAGINRPQRAVLLDANQLLEIALTT